jgi:hypothetical protein
MDKSSKNTRKSINLLPTYFQTEKNNKFLSSTLDQLYKTPSLTRINGFVGSKLTPNYNSNSDVYISNSTINASELRNKYPFQPSLTLADTEGTIKNAFGFDDLVNQLGYYGSTVNDYNRLLSPDVNSYNPHIDWDKFVNFREYYWLPLGPDSITVTGTQRNTVSTYTVTDSADGSYFIFTPDGVTEDPILTFYRGVTYVFNINSKHNFYIKTNNEPNNLGSLTGAGVSNGQIIFTVNETVPSVIYYTSDDGLVVPGTILVKVITENSSINVDEDIVGKAQYKTSAGIEFINGLKIVFAGNVSPSYYQNKEFIVEGVGSAIKLIDFNLLQTPENLATQYDADFDATPFDDYPFDNFKNLPLTPEYVTINRASRDLNPWSRYNRWFHIDVVNVSAAANGVVPVLPINMRASRPIVEFEADLQLYNFGNNSISTVDLIDRTTTNVFQTIEGSSSYTVDGVALSAGQKIIFTADKDPLVKSKVFEVTFSSINGFYKINLVESVEPVFGNTTVITTGTLGQGTELWFNGLEWVLAQQRTKLNQAPLFDLFDADGNSYSNKNYYDSIFNGNKLFGYVIGTGANDPVLGFPLSYMNVGVEGSYLFQNFFSSDTISLLSTNQVTAVPTSSTYLKQNNALVNIWVKGESYKLAVQQFQVLDTNTTIVPITVYDNSGLISDLTVSVFANNIKLIESTDYVFTSTQNVLNVKLNKSFSTTTNLLLNCYSSAAPNSTGVYETPLNLTNNPLNGEINQFTLSEISDHVQTMVQREPNFVGYFPGVSNLKSLPDISKYGTRLITNNNPLSFAQLFITDVKNSLINATRASANDYYGFKLKLIDSISQIDMSLTTDQILDQAINLINYSKNSSFPYSQSDMIGFGNNSTSKSYTVTDSRNVIYPLTSIFDITAPSNRSILIYLNGTQLIYGRDYTFDTVNPNVKIITTLNVQDVITIVDYFSTIGSYVPPTPTKLGLYPKYVPEIYKDYSYANDPVMIIQGHDGSLTVAYTLVKDADQGNYDYRDIALLEFEKRVYNNIKANYNPEIFNINKILPSVFRKSEYSYSEIYKLVQGDFTQWSSIYGLDFTKNLYYNVNNHKTYNFKQAYDYTFADSLPAGNWRGIYKYYFDTDRPNTHPWEMLGFSVKPSWWESEYGPAPYTAGNLNLWQDLEAGLIRQGDRAGIDPVYIRLGLSQVIPVDASGNVVDVREWAGIAQNGYIPSPDADWVYGDHGPVETAWRRSSLWPFAVQIICALAKPADYAAKMFDPIRLSKNATGQYRYGSDKLFLDPATVMLYSDIDNLGSSVPSSGYSVWVIENGLKRNKKYLSELKQDLSTVNFNLSYKAGGFLSKDKLEIIIDSVNPASINPGVLLPNEDYTLLFNTSNPIKSVSISGIIIEKGDGYFTVKGYDRQNAFFNINAPRHRNNDSVVNVGGKSSAYLTWTENTYYQSGQIVKYSGVFYTVVNSANSGTSFNTSNYIKLSRLPTVGGATVLSTLDFNSEVTSVPYGTQYKTLQEVYDLIVGYGQWLTNQGFIFNQFNSDLGAVIDWKFSGKEFLYWTTQGWAAGSVITLSPFADTIEYQFTDAVVDNVLDSFYDYSLLKSDGSPYPIKNFTLSRENQVCTIKSFNSPEGIYFARLNLIQKEHVIVMNNKSMFGDIVYDIKTGYRQSRMKLAGFITSDWNGDFLSPGFIYDEAIISDWTNYTDYSVGDIVKYYGKYYSATQNIIGSLNFDYTQWSLLGSAPVAQLLPNFEYKINQFEDFYSLDIDNFDQSQQKMAQHLTGYTPRLYLTNIFVDPIAQYKFYQGFIKEKGTANSIQKLAKASMHNLQGQIEFTEEWAFRIGSYGNFNSYNEIEFPLRESDFRENSQIVKFVDTAPAVPDDINSYITPSDLSIKSQNYNSEMVFETTTSSTYRNNNIILPVAGYVRLDDVTSTIYNKTSLFDIANIGSLNEGDTFWLGFKDNGSWDVYRYTVQNTRVLSSSVTLPSSELTFTTSHKHNLSVGDIVSVYGLDNETDGIYEITRIPSLSSFSVSTTLTSASLPTTVALLFKFESVRVNSFDTIRDLQEKIKFKFGDTIWADNGDGISDKWTVYKKQNNYSKLKEIFNGYQHIHQLFGQSLASRETADVLIIGAPGYYTPATGYGAVFAYNGVKTQNLTPIGLITVNSTLSSTVTNFGYSVSYDMDYSVIVAGAPSANLIQINSIDGTFILDNEVYPGSNARYGSTIYLSQQAVNGNKTLLVGAPGTGTVYAYDLLLDIINVSTTATLTATIIPSYSLSISSSTSTDYQIVGNIAGDRTAIAYADNSTVYVYSADTLLQTINAPSLCTVNDKFGQSIAMSDNGVYLFASSITAKDLTHSPGIVFVYMWNGTQYNLTDYIFNPTDDTDMYFGSTVKTNTHGDLLLVSTIGKQALTTTFDNGLTLFDNETTEFIEYIVNSGSVYSYERKNVNFILANEFQDTASLVSGSGYGHSLAITNGSIFVGAPTTTPNYGVVYEFDKLDLTSNNWSVHRYQDELVDLDKIKRAITIDSFSEKIVDYIDIIDPVKGKIIGIADQEIRYKTAFDPAVYSIGNQGVVVDTNTSWIEDHVGELWWDLSTVKYVWYEQGEIEYRKNAWGSIFPGASIDVYEWVKTEYLPSQWSSLADTTEGLYRGVSGQPKYPDNSIISVKQYYNAETGVTTDVYFYWVKNTVIVPNLLGRKISASDVASIIFNPSSIGNKFLSILSSNSLSVTNIKNDLVSNNIYLNISKDYYNRSINKHTEWMLLSEGDANSMPTTMLNKKLIDSLVGVDSLGNLIPDPSLSDRQKYGIEIRPKQGMFVNRTEALRNAIEYVNGVFSKYLISYSANFRNLNSKEEIPDVYSREYDLLLSDYDSLTSLVVVDKKDAALSCSITNGKITSINIDNPGYGFGALLPVGLDIYGNAISWAGPNVEIIPGNNDLVSNASIKTLINQNGEIISVEIENPGSVFTVAPTLLVRPYTVIVESDINSNNLWAKYELSNKKWIKRHTQDYDTTQYWSYVDWTSTNYDPLKPLITVPEPYALETVTVSLGDYVKVLNQGNGRYIILQRVNGNGTYDNDYDLVLSEKGTIQLSSSLWNTKDNWYNFDYHYTYDQTLYDQTPERPLLNILTALKDDIFVGSLKIYWNYFFFKAVKYALSEQKFLDWAFKTTFINVKNLAGSLDQRHVYKFQNSEYYENYIKEVKPYHTKIRNYQVNYDVVESTNSYITDFDSPSYYDKGSNSFISVVEGDALLSTYPWKSWYDNYKLFVESAVVSSHGSGYTSVPTVEIITAPGDTGSGATAEALISLGKVTSIKITNSGSGYTKTPSIVILGGGSTLLVPATAYARMANGKVRTNTIGLKFDRITVNNEISNQRVTESFKGDNRTYNFPLSWAAENKKANIEVTLYNTTSTGHRILATEYSIDTYKKVVNGYHKLFSNIVLNSIPSTGTTLVISYNKNIELFHAVDRIQNYYSPTVGMPGNDLAQLMSGVEFPGSQIQGLEFDYTTNWDMAPFGKSLYGDDSNFYTTATVITTAATGTDTLVVNTLQGITAGLRVTTVALTTLTTNNNKFLSSNVVVTGINTLSNSVIFSTSTADQIISNTVRLEFWEYNTTPGVLDTILDGGNLSYTTAAGVNPSDTIIDADKFVSIYTSYAPEEQIKGEMYESVGISVYTRAESGSPMITQSVIQINQTVTNTIVALPMLPPNTASTMVYYNDTVLTYGRDYTIDFINQDVIVNPQPITGILGVSVIGVGGYQFNYYDYANGSNVTALSVHVGTINEIGSIYATLNGRRLSTTEYTLSRGRLYVSNLALGNYTLQAWSFTSGGNKFSTVNEQTFVGDGVTTSYLLTIYPGKHGSANSQAIVEINNRRLMSPSTVYYSVSAGETAFLIDPANNYPPGTFDLAHLEVYVNGIKLRNGIDFVLDQDSNQILFKPGFLQTGDAMAITNHTFSDYYFANGYVYIKPTANYQVNDLLKVIDFTDGDTSLIREETYLSRPSGKYPLTRKLLNSRYIWVTIGNSPLINTVDFYLDDTGTMVVLREDYPYIPNQLVSIMSMSDNTIEKNSVGYRVFTDLLGRNQFKRISKGNTTYLAETLYSTSTKIVVQDGSVLAEPNLAKKIPGAVLIDGEWIEYLTINGNELSDLRRGSLGTGPKDAYLVGTAVIDQSYKQNAPYQETFVKQKLTATNAISYVINGTLLTTATAADQLLVYYGGKLLRKAGIYKQNTDISYDSGDINLLGTTSTTSTLVLTKFVNDAYLVTSTNQVWVYTNSKLTNAVNGYIYSGLDYYPEEFTISGIVSNGSISTATLTLNLPNIKTGTEIMLVQRLAINNMYRNTGTSVLNDNSLFSTFLQDNPSTFPDKYYYGQF